MASNIGETNNNCNEFVVCIAQLSWALLCIRVHSICLRPVSAGMRYGEDTASGDEIDPPKTVYKRSTLSHNTHTRGRNATPQKGGFRFQLASNFVPSSVAHPYTHKYNAKSLHFIAMLGTVVINLLRKAGHLILSANNIIQ